MPALLIMFSQDPDGYGRFVAAENESTPADILRELADDPDGTVARAAARNPSMPANVLERLASSECAGIRANVLSA